VLGEKAVKRWALVAECMGCAASRHSSSFLSLVMVGEFGDR
jgi:hypothetical protein